MNPSSIQYNKYKIYIQKAIKKGVGKKAKTNTTVVVNHPKKKNLPVIKNPIELEKIAKESIPTGKLEGEFWVWPDGRKTHLRFIGIAVSRYKPLPVGFYKEAKKADRINLNLLVAKAEHLGLKCTVTEP